MGPYSCAAAENSLACILDSKEFKKCVSGVQDLALMNSWEGSHSSLLKSPELWRLVWWLIQRTVLQVFESDSHTCPPRKFFTLYFPLFLFSLYLPLSFIVSRPFTTTPLPIISYSFQHMCSIRTFIKHLSKWQTVFKWVSENITWSPCQKCNLWFFSDDLCQNKSVYPGQCFPEKRDGWKSENREYKCDFMICNKKYMLGLCAPVPGTKLLKPL